MSKMPKILKMLKIKCLKCKKKAKKVKNAENAKNQATESRFFTERIRRRRKFMEKVVMIHMGSQKPTISVVK